MKTQQLRDPKASNAAAKAPRKDRIGETRAAWQERQAAEGQRLADMWARDEAQWHQLRRIAECRDWAFAESVDRAATRFVLVVEPLATPRERQGLLLSMFDQQVAEAEHSPELVTAFAQRCVEWFHDAE
jgi:hypothetical protein